MKPNKLFVSFILVAVLFSPLLAASAQEGMGELDPSAIQEDVYYVGGESEEAAALDSAFTYQGYLTNSAGDPIHDLCEIDVGLWDAATGGNRLGVVDKNDNVQVMKGYFTLTLNDAGQYGAQAFTGAPRFLEIAVRCQGSSEQALLTPRQPLMAAPYAVYAQKGGPHIGETWASNTDSAVLTIDNTGLGGTALKLNGSSNGYALIAEGGIMSTALSKIQLSPYDLILDTIRSATSTLYLGQNGAVVVNVASGGHATLVLPVQVFGVLFGSRFFVHDLKVCYSGPSNTFIDKTFVTKANHTGNGVVNYLFSDDNHSEDTYTCYTVTASTPREPINNATWIEMVIRNTSPIGGTLVIHSFELTVTESVN